MDTLVGRAYVDPLNLLEGSNTLPTEFHYMPSDPSNTVAQSLLTAYLKQTGQIPLTIDGDTSSSPYGALQTALDGVSLATSCALSLVSQREILLTPVFAQFPWPRQASCARHLGALICFAGARCSS